MHRKLLAASFLASLFCALEVSFAQASASAATPDVSSAFGEKLSVPGLVNAGKISGALFRGAQPRREGFLQLKQMGITVIVDLRAEDAHKREWERRQTEAQGIRFVSIPVGGWNAPTDAQVAQFFSLFQGDAKQRVFVHCHYGDDRTGVFVAVYRIAYDHWSVDNAIREMHFFGFRGFWHPAMESYARSFPELLQNDPILAPFRKGSPPLARTANSGAPRNPRNR
ncbi:MAG TPA: hypothetical protein VLX32_12805 [Candidatus Acidoferrum sp.]|nr:hypothetical protein [Candidatus Acidoferrum sp.]